VKPSNLATDLLQPIANVTYAKVISRSKGLNNNYNGRTVYEFNNTYEQNNITTSGGIINCSTYPHCNLGTGFGTYTGYIIQSTVLINSVKGVLGSISKVTAYDNENNIIMSDQYEYNLNSPGHMETFHEIINLSGYAYNALFSKCISVAKLKRKTSYKDGIKTYEEPITFDPITGAVTKMRLFDETNGVTEVNTNYAYGTYSGMGAKTVNSSNKNLLLEVYKSTVTKGKYVKNVYGEFILSSPQDVISGNKTTWMQNFPERVFDNSTGRYIVQTTTSSNYKPYKKFVFNGDSNDSNWREEGEFTLFNKRNNVLEMKSGISNRYASSRLGYDQKYVLVSASDCKYADFTFSSFEDQESTPWGNYFGGELSNGLSRYLGDATVLPHTGNYVSKVNGGGTFGPTFSTKGFTKGRSYRVSVWVHKNSPANSTLVLNLDGTSAGAPLSIMKTIDKSDASNVTVGDWILMTLTVDVPVDFVESGGTYGLNDMRAYVYNSGSTPAYFDDFIFRPIDADISGNVIEEKTGRTLGSVDGFGFGLKYIYDDTGALREVWQESAANGWKLKTRYSYNFKRTY